MFSEMLLGIQIVLAAMFSLSVAGKVLDPSGFIEGVAEYKILPSRLTYSLGVVLIFVELFLAVSHLTGWLLGLAAPIALVTLSSFAVAISVNLRRGRVLPCYCFGRYGSEMISGETLARVIMLICAELLVALKPMLIHEGLVYKQQVTVGVTLVLATALLLTGMWVLSVPDLIRVLRSGRSYCRKDKQ